MLKKILLWVLLPLVLLFIGVMIWAYWMVAPNPERVLAFIEKHPNKSAICFQWNGKIQAAQHADTVMPLASAVKTIIAIEFAKQAAAGLIDTAEWIDSLELDKFYLANTDGGDHVAWLEHLEQNNLIANSKIKLLEVAKGMIAFSSNANTEYLMDKLGLQQINALTDSLGLSTHTPLYPFVSALFVLQNNRNLEYKKHIEYIDLMTPEAYFSACDSVHLHLKNTPGFKSRFKPEDLDLKVQRIWSNRLPGAAAKDYVRLMQLINSDHYFSKEVKETLALIMEQDMDDEEPQKHFVHYGNKGGSTAYVLTEACYITDKQNNKAELAVFFNNLTQMENLKLQTSIHAFEIKLFTDEAFRQQVINTINKP